MILLQSLTVTFAVVVLVGIFLVVMVALWVEHREFMLRLAIGREMRAQFDQEKLNLLISIYPTLRDCGTFSEAIERISESEVAPKQIPQTSIN